MPDKKTIAAMSVLISADNAKFRQSMKSSRTSMTGFQNSAASLKSSLIGMFSIVAITSFVKAAQNAYDVQDKAEAKLLTALDGRAEVQERLIRQASFLQGRTLFGDEQTIEAQSRLASILGNNELTIRKLIPLVQDFAEAKRMDLAQAAELVAKSVGTSTNALVRYGIQIEGAVGSSERLESAVRNLNDQVGGQAEAAALAGMGAMDQLKNSWGDLLEQIGGATAPGLTKPANKLTEFFTNLNSIPKGVPGRFGLAFMQAYTDTRKTVEMMIQAADELAAKESENTEIIKAKIPLLQQLQDELNLASTAQQNALTENDLAKANRDIKLINDKIKALKELGTVQSFWSTEKDPGLTSIQPKQITSIDFQTTSESDMFNSNMLDKQNDLLIQITDNNDKFIAEQYRLAEELAAVNNIIVGGFSDMVAGIGTSLGNSLSGEATNFSQALLTPLGDMAIQLGKLAITTGIGILGIKTALKSMNPYVAIAAGVALVALGTAVKNSISSMSAGMNSGIPSTSINSSSGSSDWEYNRNIGDRSIQVVKVEVTGDISNETIRLANKRATEIHELTT